MSLYIKSLAHFAPAKKLTNADLEKMVDTNDEWIVARTGIRERSIADKGTGASDLAKESSLLALQQAKMDPSELDAIVVATCSPDTTIPGASSHLQAHLQAPTCPAFDINAACSGFIYGMEVCEGLLATGRYNNILLSCTEKFSSLLNYEDRNTCILFGDASGSLILSQDPGIAKMVAAYSGGDGKLIELLYRPGGGSKHPHHECENLNDLFLTMEGKEVFKHAVRGFAQSAEVTLERAGWNKEEVNWLIPHQANMRLIKSAADRLDLPMEKVVANIDRYGNTSAASIPLAMSEAQSNFKPGDKVLCLAFGAGFTWGGIALEWMA